MPGESGPEEALNTRISCYWETKDKRERNERRMRMAQMRRTPRVITKEDREACLRQLEEENPGYLEMEESLRMVVWILTGVRILYSIFYLVMSLQMYLLA